MGRWVSEQLGQMGKRRPVCGTGEKRTLSDRLIGLDDMLICYGNNEI